MVGMNFGKEKSEAALNANRTRDGIWKKTLDSSDRERLSICPIYSDELYSRNEFEIKPLSFVLYEMNR